MERLLVYDDRWIGGPLTRDDEGRRVIAQTTKRETNSQSRDDEGRRVIAQITKRETNSQSRDDEGRRVIAQITKRETNSQSRDTASHYAFLAEFTALFVLGMFIGIAAVLVASTL